MALKDLLAHSRSLSCPCNWKHVALYSSAFTFGFANLQGIEIYVVANPHVNKGLTGDGLKWAFQAGYASNWHPLTWTSHMVDVQIYKGNAGGHNATSIALHALNAALVFLVMLRMTGFFWRSAVIAAFFAWHPLQVESVAWIAERKIRLVRVFRVADGLDVFVLYRTIKSQASQRQGVLCRGIFVFCAGPDGQTDVGDAALYFAAD